MTPFSWLRWMSARVRTVIEEPTLSSRIGARVAVTTSSASAGTAAAMARAKAVPAPQLAIQRQKFEATSMVQVADSTQSKRILSLDGGGVRVAAPAVSVCETAAKPKQLLRYPLAATGDAGV